MLTGSTFRGSRATRLVVFFLCGTMLFSMLVTAGSDHTSISDRQQSRPGNPEAGPPEATLPNLNEVRRRPHPRPEAPPHIPSLVRGRRKPFQPRNGRKVGDRGTTGEAIGIAGQPPVATTASDTSSKEHLSGNNAGRLAKLAQRTSLRFSPDTFDSLAIRSQPSFYRPMKRLNHARLGGNGVSPTPVSGDEYMQTFFQCALGRTPSPTEQSYWNDILRAAYAPAQSSMVMAAREMGKTLFESADYAARARSNHDYVYDLYKTYLLRSPDSGGWAYWESVVPAIGRENVRRAFDESGEFISKVATVTLTGSPSSGVTSLLSARADMNNQSGNQLLARDAEWSATLLRLHGRSGLDLGLAISYSSAAVWTRSGPYIYFDDDNSSLSPGFRLGFPTVQELFFNAQTGRNAYLLITSAGTRVELRQLGTSNIYETADSSYLQLTDTSSTDGKLLLRSTDGTRMTYNKIENEWRCKEVKDRNGNYLTINYNSLGDLTSVVDTLGRTITFVYDGNANLSEIQQMWHRDLQSGGQTNDTHKWATFRWGSTTIQPNFSGVALTGIANGQSIPVLTMVGLDDGTYYKFEYTNWNSGQVARITHYASDSNPDYDNHERSHTAYTYLASDDNTRLTETRVAAENWTGINGVPSEVITQYAIDGAAHTAAVVDDPNGVLYKEFYGTGWQSGLTTATEIWAGGQEKKWTSTTWTQDNTGVSYKTNPRVTETNVYDSSNNRRRTVIDYQPTFGLPSCITDYAANASTPIRFTCRGYKNDDAFISRRIIGLPYVDNVFDGNWKLYSKTMYEYDWAESMTAQAPSMQHDTTNYGSSFSFGRGFLVGVRRYNVNAPDDTSQAVWVMRRGFNLAGGITFTKDGSDHQTNVEYSDSFSDGNNSRNTLAYPTKVKDADWNPSTAPNNYATAQYNFDLGVVFRLQGPSPKNPATGQPYSQWGAIRTYYDTAGRVDTVKNEFNGSYSRYVYGPYYVQNYASVNTAGDDSYAIQIFDGAGRVIGQASNHPGSAGGYKAQLSVYDRLGQTVKQSNPAEITAGWMPAGDDTAGWLYTQQTYDWKGRLLVTTHPDSTTKVLSYGGCGCAGGEVVTLTDEGTIDNGQAKRRQQIIYSDVLGRPWKTEVLNWQSGSQYATTVSTYNARDQITMVRQYEGAEGTAKYQDTVMGYDGHGRLQSKHVPEQSTGTATTYTYRNDDTVNVVTDARGAAQTFSYNNRHLVTGISYTAPSGITPTAPVTYAYDAVGNRTAMTDGLGSQSYSYDQLSRLTSETRAFTNLGAYTLSYAYTLGGDLKSITDPVGAEVGYTRDIAGQVSAVTGSGFGNVSTYASSLQYRASGALKHLTYGDGRTLDLNYDSRLQTSSFTVSGVVSVTYQHYDDGRLRSSSDLLDRRFDRSYSYDQANQMIQALSGAEARGEPATADRPFNQSFAFNAFGNMIGRAAKHWSKQQSSFLATFSNNRVTGSTYDADGRELSGSGTTERFDAAGLLIQSSGPARRTNPALTMTQSFDGERRPVKSSSFGLTTYLLRSTVLAGATIVEINGTPGQASFGQKQKGHVYVNGKQLAEQNTYLNVPFYKSYDPSSSVEGTHFTHPDGTVVVGRTQLDALQDDVGSEDPYQAQQKGGSDPGFNYPLYGDVTDLGHGCSVDGMPMMCTSAWEYKNSGGAGNVNAGTIGGMLALGLAGGVGLGRSAALNSLGATPLLGRICTSASSGGVTASQCSTEVVGFTSDSYMASSVILRSAVPQNSTDSGKLNSNIKVVNTGGDTALEKNKDEVISRIEYMAKSTACNDAFKRAGLKTPLQMVQGGITLASRRALTDSSYNSALGITEEIRKEANTSGAPAQTIRPQFTSSGLPVIIIGGDAFGDNYLEEAIPHEMIHAAGFDKAPGWFGHDLKRFPYYGDIVINCRLKK